MVTHNRVDGDTAIVCLFGRRVRQYRWSQQWPVEELAARAELPVDVVRQIEAGEFAYRQLRAKMLLGLADALNVSVIDLVL